MLSSGAVILCLAYLSLPSVEITEVHRQKELQLARAAVRLEAYFVYDLEPLVGRDRLTGVRYDLSNCSDELRRAAQLTNPTVSEHKGRDRAIVNALTTVDTARYILDPIAREILEAHKPALPKSDRDSNALWVKLERYQARLEAARHDISQAQKRLFHTDFNDAEEAAKFEERLSQIERRSWESKWK